MSNSELFIEKREQRMISLTTNKIQLKLCQKN